jgi:hypothetical protein
VKGYLRKEQFKEENIYFGSQFYKFQSMVAWPHNFEPDSRLNIMVGVHRGAKKLLHGD